MIHLRKIMKQLAKIKKNTVAAACNFESLQLQKRVALSFVENIKTNWKSFGLEDKMHFPNEFNVHFRFPPAYTHNTAHYERVIIRFSRLLLFRQLTTKHHDKQNSLSYEIDYGASAKKVTTKIYRARG